MDEPKITREQIVDALKTVYDPEIPVDIYELGLIYDIKIKDKKVFILMTLTTPNCPSAQSLPMEVKDRVSRVPGVEDADVEIVWDPPWGMEMMSEEARLELGYF
ncbi:MAG TPA: SUF system Fe-S cluster assembly protein [Caldithrix abyssi]|uniref:SUF system Fe-S cluster assembly protein n=1 Tax=Caldithrix abyssi TaxID=187145 RepID=A0A7V1LNV5_CALAY|nr:SUF system Fe-S cluster assembly protein [Caldithrix abyssi]